MITGYLLLCWSDTVIASTSIITTRLWSTTSIQPHIGFLSTSWCDVSTYAPCIYFMYYDLMRLSCVWCNSCSHFSHFITCNRNDNRCSSTMYSMIISSVRYCLPACNRLWMINDALLTCRKSVKYTYIQVLQVNFSLTLNCVFLFTSPAT